LPRLTPTSSSLCDRKDDPESLPSDCGVPGPRCRRVHRRDSKHHGADARGPQHLIPQRQGPATNPASGPVSQIRSAGGPGAGRYRSDASTYLDFEKLNTSARLRQTPRR
jgi:hypothetical protein